MTTVRRYRPEDASAVRRLHGRVIREAGTDPADLPNGDDVADIQGEYLDAGGEFLVAERENRVVGMGGLRVDDDEGELHRMRVALDCQRRGVGSRLLAALERAARDRGVACLWARTARRQEAAVEFYPANGYDRVGSETYGDYDLLVYRKSLTESGHR